LLAYSSLGARLSDLKDEGWDLLAYELACGSLKRAVLLQFWAVSGSLA